MNPFSKRRRTPNGTSGGSWSISSSHGSSVPSLTDGAAGDAFMQQPDGPRIGRRLRGPVRSKSGAAAVGGVVFGQELQRCVEMTRAERVRDRLAAAATSNEGAGEAESMLKERVAVLEERMLPAIVVRCAQHLMTWGVQEEGLFR
jgi:hypothetical protein